jgi:perosamine synthetase
MVNISLSQPDITQKEIKGVVNVLKTPNLALGPKLKEFEDKFAKYIGAKYAVAVNSGTSGLHLLIRALGIKKGDEVITTPFSFIASANCALYEGAKPVFVDIDPLTLNIDPKKIEKAITKRTKAMVIVDIFSHPADWDPILKIAKKYNLKVIEDSCEALGAIYKSQIKNKKQKWIKCGNFDNAAVFSFYPNKPMTTGEGGMIITNNENIADNCHSMTNQGRKVENGKWLEHVQLGYDYRMSDMNAALGITQLSRIKEILKKRNRVAEMYNNGLKNVSAIKIPYVAPWAKISWFVYVIQLTKEYTRYDRDKIMERLRKKGIQCSNYFQCIHLQPFYKKMFGYKKGDFPVAESVSDRTIALPFYSNLGKNQIDYVIENLKKLL